MSPAASWSCPAVAPTVRAFNLSSGDQLQFTGSTAHTLDASSSVGGAGSVIFSDSGGVTLAGAYAVTGGTSVTNTTTFNMVSVNLPSLTLSGGTLNGSANVTITGGTNTWSGGTMSGSGTTTVAGGATLALNGVVTLSRSLASLGTVNWTNQQVSGAGTFTNLSGGVFNANLSTGRAFAPAFDNQTGATFTHSGSVTDTFSGSFDNSGAVEVDAGTLTLSGTVAQLSGSTLTGGTWTVASGVLNLPGSNLTTIGSGASVTLSGGSASFPKLASLASIQGSFTVSGGANYTSVGLLTSTGETTVGSGSTLATASGTGFQVAGGTTFLEGGTISSNAFIGASGGGILAGTGTLNGNVVMADGVLSPGESPGILTIDGNLSMNSTTVTNIEIQGTNPATPDYDQIFVNGTVALDGTLNVTLLGGFTPMNADSFQFIINDNTDAITGTFTGLTEGTQFGVDSSSFTISYIGGTGNDAVLTAVLGGTFVVTTISDSGAGSLRQAILDANAHAGADFITFSIGTGIGLVKTITPTSALPAITDAVTIDGYTQSGARRQHQRSRGCPQYFLGD